MGGAALSGQHAPTMFAEAGAFPVDLQLDHATLSPELCPGGRDVDPGGAAGATEIKEWMWAC